MSAPPEPAAGALEIRVRRLPHGRGLPLPAAASSGSAGLDLAAAVGEPVRISPGDRALVPTGLVIELPPGWEGQIRPRSGLAWRYGLTLANAPGTLDSDYRGELQVALINLGRESFTVSRGDRIAQLVVTPVPRVTVREVEQVGGTERGGGGFGSSGR